MTVSLQKFNFRFVDDQRRRGGAKILDFRWKLRDGILEEEVGILVKFCSMKRVTSHVRKDDYELVSRGTGVISSNQKFEFALESMGNFILQNVGPICPRRPQLIICDQLYQAELRIRDSLFDQPKSVVVLDHWVVANCHATSLQQPGQEAALLRVLSAADIKAARPRKKPSNDKVARPLKEFKAVACGVAKRCAKAAVTPYPAVVVRSCPVKAQAYKNQEPRAAISLDLPQVTPAIWQSLSSPLSDQLKPVLASPILDSQPSDVQPPQPVQYELPRTPVLQSCFSSCEFQDLPDLFQLGGESQRLSDVVDIEDLMGCPFEDGDDLSCPFTSKSTSQESADVWSSNPMSGGCSIGSQVVPRHAQ